MSRSGVGFLIGSIACLGAGVLVGCGASAPAEPLRVLIIGIDGMDPVILQQLMDEGKMPHFKSLARRGSFRPLATSMPPQSPVAWSNVISGGDPGVHQIFDFLHRDPKTYIPILSTGTANTWGQMKWLPFFGPWQIPRTSLKPELRRRGPTFWRDLIRAGIDTWIYRIPANYPAEEEHGPGLYHCLTGMGTPDLVTGSYGRFTVFTEDPPVRVRDRTVPGGWFVPLYTDNHRAEGEIEGPPNFLREPDEKGKVPNMSVKFVVVRDPERDLVKITIGDDLRLLKRGEWSGWFQFEFETGIPGATMLQLATPTTLPGMAQFYVKQVHPTLELFLTPVNIDPSRPANPVSVPAGFAKELADATGLYFTAGIPEHTPEVQQGGLHEDEWLEKANMIFEQRVKQYRYALDQFDAGCLFYYFGTLDLVSHIFWRDRDPEHPGRDPEQGDRYALVIEEGYVKFDILISQAMEALGPSDVLIVMSDHGFTSFRRGFNLNTWLLDNGYIVLRDPRRQEKDKFFQNVNWSRTRAYALGLNGLYINEKGRERHGIVKGGDEKRKLLEEISQKLRAVRDDDGSAVVLRNYIVSDVYPGADSEVAPDLLVGYARNYRGNWSSMLGGMPKALMEDNHNRWSGDHCIAAEVVPGILLSNRRIVVDDPALTDIGPTVLRLFGLPIPPDMKGRPVLVSR